MSGRDLMKWVQTWSAVVCRPVGGLALIVLLAAIGCTGAVSTGGGGGGSGSGPGSSVPVGSPIPGSQVSNQGSTAFGPTAIRRLSATEVRNAIEDALGIDVSDLLGILPLDEETPFDNDYNTQTISPALITGFDSLAKQAGERFVEVPAARDAVAGCSPSGPGDQVCFLQLARRLGRLLFRRGVSDTELSVYLGFLDHSVAADDYNVAVRMLVRAMVQDPEFVYRLELGAQEPGQPNLLRLSAFEVASRLSFLLWGSGPDDQLLDSAEAGMLYDSAGIQAEATRMLADPRAKRQLQRFNRQWLAFKEEALPASLVDDMVAETQAAIQRIVFDEGRPFTDLFTLDETFVTPELAQHYGLPSPGAAPGWVRYPDSRGGILSHASYLSTSSKFEDTSPVVRGLNVNQRLLCRTIPEPPPGIDVDEPPIGVGVGPNACRYENYDMSRRSECSSCHTHMDPIGFGLEPYGPDGAFRDHQPNRPDCEFDGQGTVEGLGGFSGPGELGSLLVGAGDLEGCFVDHLYRFAVGRPAGMDDAQTLERFQQDFIGDDDLSTFLIGFVSVDAFRYRVVEEN